jgi:Ala-tRNA(Pro) deacylase
VSTESSACWAAWQPSTSPSRHAQLEGMLPPRLLRYLETLNVPHTALPHLYTPSSRMFAITMGVSGYTPVRTVAFRANGALWLAALSAGARINMAAVMTALSTEHLQPETDPSLFQGCEPAALPPFAGLFGAQVLMDASLPRLHDFVFRGGTFEDAVEMKSGDYLALEHPLLASFAIASAEVEQSALLL